MSFELFQKYPYRVRIYQTKGGTKYVQNDFGRRVEKKDGTVRLRLKVMKKDLPFPDYQFVYTGPKGQYIDYYSPAESEFFPMKVGDNEQILEKNPVDKDVIFWGINEYDRIQKKYAKEEKWWKELLPVIMLGMAVAGTVFMTIFVGQTLVQIAGTTSSMQDKNIQFFEKWDQILEKVDTIINDKQQILAKNLTGNTPARPPFG